MSKQFIASVAVLAAAFMLMAGYFVSAGSIGAQGADATPAGESAPHPAHIHSGTCAELGDVIFPLNDVMATDLTASPEAVGSLPSTTGFCRGRHIGHTSGGCGRGKHDDR